MRGQFENVKLLVEMWPEGIQAVDGYLDCGCKRFPRPCTLNPKLEDMFSAMNQDMCTSWKRSEYCKAWS